jgi:Protein of unknown function (DUF2946)
LARRVIALAAAYAIALSGLIAGFGAAPSAIADPGSSGIVLCHSTGVGRTVPPGDHNGDCNNSCCVGCVLLLAAVPPPPTTSVAIERTQVHLLPMAATVQFPFDPQIRSHQSRAPPLAA